MQRALVGVLPAVMVGAALAAMAAAPPGRGAWRSAEGIFQATLAAATSCETLATALPNVTIASAQTVGAGAFTPPPAPARGQAAQTPGPAPAAGGARGGGSGGSSFADLPAFCRVRGTIRTSGTSSVRFEVWMPVSGWNGNFLSNGFAFYGGTMNPGPLANAIRRGYATATTDLGGDGTPSAAYLTGHPEALADWNERGWHETTLTAKALIAAFYGSPPKVSYWEACGGGTRQGLKAIARFPADYDALAGGGLSNGTTFFTFAQIWQWEATHKDPASLIPREKLPLLHDAALEACDARDGIKDGVIQDPEHCRFDPGALQCQAADGPGCLTAAQVEAARKLYAPVINPRTRETISGPLMPGSELSWNASPSPAPGGFAADFFRYLVFQDPGWDYTKRPINYDTDVALANRPEIGAISAVEPDLGPFLRRGGKSYMSSTDRPLTCCSNNRMPS